jgi:hypothetical protein
MTLEPHFFPWPSIYMSPVCSKLRPKRAFPLDLQFSRCIRGINPSEYQVTWCYVLELDLSILPPYCLCLIVCSIASSLDSSIVSFNFLSSSSVEAITLAEPNLISSRVTATSPKRTLNGVKSVDHDIEVLWFHTTLISSYVHFPFRSPAKDFVIPRRIMSFTLSTNPLDFGCVINAKCMLWRNRTNYSSLSA